MKNIKDMNLKEFLSFFTTECEDIRSNRTMINYCSRYRVVFKDFFNKEDCDISMNEILNLEPGVISKFVLKTLENKNVSSSTYKSVKATFNFLYEYLINNNLINENPFVNLENSYNHESLPNVNIIKEEHFKSILKGASKTKYHIRKNADFNGARNYALLYVLFETGIKSTDVCNIKLKDLNLEDKTINILGVNKVLSKGCIKSLEEYLKQRDINNVSSTYLFVTINNKNKTGFKAQTVECIFKQSVKLGLGDKYEHYSVNDIRRTILYNAYKNGEDLETLMKLSNYKSKSSLNQYLKKIDKAI